MKKVAVYCGTRNIYKDMVTAAKSLIMHSDVDKVYFLIEDDEFPFEIPDIIETINVSDQKYFKPDGPNMTSKFTYLAMMRIALSKVFPDLDRVLSLDVDTIVAKDISDIWDTDLDGYYFAAVPETHRSHNGLLYTNAGVTLYNLKKMRDGKADECIEVLNLRRYPWIDQDVQNYLCQGHIQELPSDYNDTDFTKRPNGRKIIHFAGIKKWNHYPMVKMYQKYTWEYVLRKK